MIVDASALEIVYRYAASAYWYIERHCHDDIDPARAKQRDITGWSFEVVRGVRPDVQPFTNLLIQFPDPEDDEVPDRLAPDNSVFLHSKPLKIGASFDTPLQPVGPFLVVDYAAKSDIEKYNRRQAEYEKRLKVPYYLLFYPDGEEMTLFKLGEKRYVAVPPNAAKRCAIPELELEVALLDRWVRYWFRGELVPLPGDLLKARDAERAARLAAEAELARLRDELAKAKKA